MNRILVIERDAKIRDLLSRFLGVKGYDVTATVDAATGMDRFISERPDLILVDMQLPDMSGLELCRAVRDTRLDVALVLMGTGRQSRRPAVEEARVELAIPQFLVKPFGVDALLTAIQKGLAGEPAAAPEPPPAPPRPAEPAAPAVSADAARVAVESTAPPAAEPPPEGMERVEEPSARFLAAGPASMPSVPAVTGPTSRPSMPGLVAVPPVSHPSVPGIVAAAPRSRPSIPGIVAATPVSHPSVPGIAAPPSRPSLSGIEPLSGDVLADAGPATLEEIEAVAAPPAPLLALPELPPPEPPPGGDPAESYGASTAGGLLSGGAPEPVDDPGLMRPESTAARLEAVYALEDGENHTWGLESLRMEAIRHGGNVVADDEQRYALQPIVPQSPSDPRGIYGAITVPNLLYRSFRDLFTGRLIIRRGPVRKVIILANGRPIGAESNIRSESLGYMLLQEGLIDQRQLEQSGRLARNVEMRQGEALVRMGAIDADMLADALRRQMRQRILSCFAWSGAEYGLTYEPDIRAQLDAIEQNPLVLIFDGIKTSFPIAPLVAHFDERNRSPVSATPRLRDYATMLRDFAGELRVAALCDGQRTLGEVLAQSPYGLVDSLRILRALEITGCLEFAEQQAPIVEQASSPRAAVGGSLDGSVSAVAASFNAGRSTQNRRPRRTPEGGVPRRTTIDVGGSLDGSVGGSVDGDLSADRRRPGRSRREITRSAPTGPDLVKADANFAKGRRCLEEEDLQNALAHFQLACKQDPHQHLFKMYRGWVRFVLAPPADRKARVEAHDEIKAALDADPNQDEGYVLLGNIYRELGRDDKAMKLYRKALSLNRRNPAANRAIREMEGRRALEERDPQGLFGKFFTRR